MLAVRIAIHLRHATRPRQEGGNLFFVIAHLEAMVIDDDRSLEDGWVLLDKGDEFRDGHGIEVDIVFHHDLRTRGDDIIRAILAFGDDLDEFRARKLLAEDIMDLVGDALIVEPLPHFAAARAAWGSVDLDHTGIIIPSIESVCT